MTVARLQVLALCSWLLASHAQAWVPNHPNDCGSVPSAWITNPPAFIEIRWAIPGSTGSGTSKEFTSAERDIVRKVFQSFNHLPNAQIYFFDGNSSCTGEQWQNTGVVQPANTICVTKKANRCCGQSHSPGCGNFCEIEIGEKWLIDEDLAWKGFSQELGHCMGLDHPGNTRDWMEHGVSSSSGGTGEHVAMTRDTMNGLSWRFPFSQSYYFVDQNADGRSDILTRFNVGTNNVVNWYLTTQTTSNTWANGGLVITDLGDDTTLAYLAGDFDGNGTTDMTRGLCNGCNPADGLNDTITWGVQRNGGGFSEWINDFGNGEDYDQYRVGDFDGNGCDDIWLVRSNSSASCDGNLSDPNAANACTVTLWWALAGDGNGDGICDNFGTHWNTHKMTVSDRSAASAWPWVVGNFVGNACTDIAYGTALQGQPTAAMQWRVLEAFDSNGNGLCDSVRTTNGNSSWGALGSLGGGFYFSADVGRGTSGSAGRDDIIEVSIPVLVSSTNARKATWSVMYSNGVNAFVDLHSAVNDGVIFGTEDRWTARVFGVGRDVPISQTDFISVLGLQSSTVSAYLGDRATGNTWSLASGSTTTLPGPATGWQIPIFNGRKQRERWWCEECDILYCQTCSGCCN